jgi:hypothetical protein
MTAPVRRSVLCFLRTLCGLEQYCKCVCAGQRLVKDEPAYKPHNVHISVIMALSCGFVL